MPNTVNRGLSTPNTGDLVGTWGTAAVNPNMQVIDGCLGGVVTVSLTNANVSLSITTGVIGTGSLTPGAGPVQADNAVIKFSGTLTGNCVITFPCPGFWIVENNCTVGAFTVQARALGTGNVIGLPPGEPIHVYNDGTDCKFVDMGRVGSYLDLCASTTPAWMTACTIRPYLLCDGTTYSSSIATALSIMLGSTFGGNGVNTFGVPDLANRYRIPLDTNASGRITLAGSGITGTLLGAAGGNQLLQAHSHTASVTDPGHFHGRATTPGGAAAGTAVLGSVLNGNGGTGAGIVIVQSDGGAQYIANATTGISVANATAGSAVSGNIPPALVAGLTFIKT